jgi:hypothetical protein
VTEKIRVAYDAHDVYTHTHTLTHAHTQQRADRAGNVRYTPTVLKSAEFMKAHAEVKQVETRSGYNPMLEDFQNTAFFLVECD